MKVCIKQRQRKKYVNVFNVGIFLLFNVIGILLIRLEK